VIARRVRKWSTIRVILTGAVQPTTACGVLCQQSMIDLAFALLDLRRLIHIAAAAMIIAAIHAFGSSSLKSEVDRLVVNPVTRVAQSVTKQFQNSIAAVQSAVGYVASN
jgi:hypothetical protein